MSILKILYSLVIIVTLTISRNCLAVINGRTDPDLNNKAEQLMSKRAVLFIENNGQIPEQKDQPDYKIFFKASAQGIDLYITNKGLSYIFLKSEAEKNEAEEWHGEKDKKTEYSRIDMELKGARIVNSNIIRENPSKEHYNFFYAHCPQGIYDVKKYEKITIKQVYPGIDWILYSTTQKGFKYDFIVHPGADPSNIILAYRSLVPLEIDRSGNINLHTKLGDLTEDAPLVFSEGNAIPAKFVKIQNKTNYETAVGFGFPENYDHTKILIIDPQLTWGTYAGSAIGGEGPLDIAIDKSGSIYITGYSQGVNSPAGFPLQSWGYFNGTHNGYTDMFILKFSNTGVLQWGTYYGGGAGNTFADNDAGSAITVDLNGNIYVAGTTDSPAFPTQNPGGGAYFDATYNGSGGCIYGDAVLLKFNNTGVRQWATYIGTSGCENILDLITDPTGNLIATGLTNSAAFPTVNPGGGSYFDASYNGGGSRGDAILLKFSSACALLWSTFLGGSSDDRGKALDLDAAGNLYLQGEVKSTNFPTLNPGGGAYYDNTLGGPSDVIISKFSTTGSLLWSTYYGGSSDEMGYGIKVDRNSNLYILGRTNSSDLPILNPGGGAHFDPNLGGTSDAFISKYSNTGALQWGSYFGGSAIESEPYDGYDMMSFNNIKSDSCGNIFISVTTNSANMPLKNPGCSSYYDGLLGGNNFNDVFFASFTSMSALAWGSYFGGDDEEFWGRIEIDGKNNLFSTGEHRFTGNLLPFPNPGGGAYYDNTHGGSDDINVIKFVPVSLQLTTSQVGSGCSCSGIITATPSCGTPPYKYFWSNGASTIAINNVCPGNYSLTVSDASCQIKTETFILTGGNLSSNMNISYSASSCTNYGSANVTPIGGSSPYTYLWSSGQSTQTSTGMTSGVYTVTITDNSGCTNTAMATIITNPSLSGQFNKGTANCPECGCKEWIMVTATGGSGPYSYTWPDGYINRYKNQLCPGTYTINIKDTNGCSVNVNLSAP